MEKIEINYITSKKPKNKHTFPPQIFLQQTILLFSNSEEQKDPKSKDPPVSTIALHFVHLIKR